MYCRSSLFELDTNLQYSVHLTPQERLAREAYRIHTTSAMSFVFQQRETAGGEKGVGKDGQGTGLSSSKISSSEGAPEAGGRVLEEVGVVTKVW